MKRFVFLILLIGFIYTGFSQTTKISHKYYTIYFNTEKKLPVYTYYVLTKEHRAQKVERSEFHSDALIDKSLQTNVTDYDGHKAAKCDWYDAGHLAPDDDFRFSEESESDAMVFTNVAPQQSNFNEAVWKGVENAVRKLCDDNGDVKVWTGVSYSNGGKVNGIPKPAYYWKVAIYSGGKIEWIGDNNCNPGRSEKDLRTANINEVEKRTNLSFN